MQAIVTRRELNLLGRRKVAFDTGHQLIFSIASTHCRSTRTGCALWLRCGPTQPLQNEGDSIGGGFVVDTDAWPLQPARSRVPRAPSVRH